MVASICCSLTNCLGSWSPGAVFFALVSDTSQDFLVPLLARVTRPLEGDELLDGRVVLALVVVLAVARVSQEPVHAVRADHHRTIDCNTTFYIF